MQNSHLINCHSAVKYLKKSPFSFLNKLTISSVVCDRVWTVIFSFFRYTTYHWVNCCFTCFLHGTLILTTDNSVFLINVSRSIVDAYSYTAPDPNLELTLINENVKITSSRHSHYSTKEYQIKCIAKTNLLKYHRWDNVHMKNNLPLSTDQTRRKSCI